MATESDVIRRSVLEIYDEIARADEATCGCGCAPTDGSHLTVAVASARMGYSQKELDALPDGSDLGLGCGNPQAIAVLQPGETVLDLGSGAGIDCFLAGRQVTASGRVIGVDMTASMIAKARTNAAKVDLDNVEFRLGEIEHLPVADSSIDVIISNCVINLSPDKPAVYAEAFRVLKAGGRLAISDVVALTELSAEVKDDMELLGSCVSGAATIPELEEMLTDIGFGDIQIKTAAESRDFIQEWAPGSKMEDYVVSASIEATKS
ncbi:MAG: arsenite methyltransferase [Acidobacteria bacterium]|nr:arsenite methyltransferase [Acidobacteriota bacterium]